MPTTKGTGMRPSFSSHFGPLVTGCLAAVLVLIVSACSATPSLNAVETTSFDETAAQNEAAQNGATADSAVGLDEVEAAFEDLTDEEAELFLEAFEDAFNGAGSATAAGDSVDASVDEEEVRATVPADGGPINPSASVPYGTCDYGWVVFDLLTWNDAIAMVGFDPATHTGVAPDDSYEYDNPYYDDAGAAFLDNSHACAPGDFGDGQFDMRLRMRPGADVTYSDKNYDPAWFDGELQFLTTQAGQPMTVKLSGFDGTVDRAEVILHWQWSGSPDGASQLVIELSDYEGVTDAQIEGAINIAEVISASAEFMPPAFESPLPGWYSCEGRNFVHSDVAEVAEIAGINGPFELFHDIQDDWSAAECAIGAPGGDDFPAGDFGVIAQVFPAGSDEYEQFVEEMTVEASAVGSITVAGRPMSTYSSEQFAVVILDDGTARVAIVVLPQNRADADATLATAIEITEIIAR